MKHKPDKDYLVWIRTQHCIAASNPGSPCSQYITAHHIRQFGSAANDRRTVPLCVAHHLHGFGPDSIEHGRARFENRFSIDLEDEIQKFNAAYSACP